MKKSSALYKKSLFIFRRDLRYDDNTALQQALEMSGLVVACFIIDPLQVGKKNAYKSDFALRFMVEAVQDLSQILAEVRGRLYIFYGNPSLVVNNLIIKENIEAVFVNRDYTPYSLKRDAEIERVCKKLEATFHSYDDLLLHKPESIRKKTGGTYSVFTPFYKAAMKHDVPKAVKISMQNFYTKSINDSFSDPFEKIIVASNKKDNSLGKRSEAIQILRHMDDFRMYDKVRDFPCLNATTHLAPYIKFGVCSIREVYEAIVKLFGKNHTLIKQLLWRDFFTYIAFYHPHVFGLPFYKKYSLLPWDKSIKKFRCWREGKTGFPLVDAGIRQLITTGFMHNRLRMITASFLVKDLHIDWREGERFFATHLVDYDPSVNNGNWQWVASTGCDAQPYFRVFNPWLQQKKFDKDCMYIKTWLPELKNVPNKDIHNWHKTYKKYKNVYLQPIIDHDSEQKKAKILFSKLSSS